MYLARLRFGLVAWLRMLLRVTTGGLATRGLSDTADALPETALAWAVFSSVTCVSNSAIRRRISTHRRVQTMSVAGHSITIIISVMSARLVRPAQGGGGSGAGSGSLRQKRSFMSLAPSAGPSPPERAAPGLGRERALPSRQPRAAPPTCSLDRR